MIEKFIKDGQVAVLVSPGFGAGWSTWNYDSEQIEFMLFDANCVKAVLAGQPEKAAQIVQNQFDEHVCVLGAEDLTVEFIEQGQRFRINEYDGSETLVLLHPESYYIA